MAIKSLSIRIDTEMLDKLHVVADYEGPLRQQPNQYSHSGLHRRL